MEVERIYTEEPENELWRWLLQYSYKANIRRYFHDNDIITSTNNDEVENIYNSISGAILQADEYYRAGKTASLQIKPLLLYYGSTNLLYALYSLKNGALPQIKNHGMRINSCDQDEFIADTEIVFENYSDGAVHKFAPLLGVTQKLNDYRGWKLTDFIDSIAEISMDYEKCYRKRASILLLDTVQTPTGIIEKVYLSQEESNLLQKVEGFSNSYLSPQFVNGKDYVILRHKLCAKPISFTTYSGQSYLQIAHQKSGKEINISSTLGMYVSMFVLSSLCRYRPGRWNPFVLQDTSGEKLVLENLLYYSRRILPNTILNLITGKQIIFVSDKYVPEDRVHHVGEHEVREIISGEIQKQMKKELAQNILHK